MSDLHDINLQPTPEKKLVSDRYPELLDAVQTLYIKGNMGGRVNFIKSWPAVAGHILGAELIAFDTEGTDDFERRAVLEEEAEDRRHAFAELLKTLEAKSVDKGALQLEYVEGLITGWGRDIAELVYADRLVDRFLGPAPKREVVEEAPVEQPVPSPVQEVAPVHVDADSVKPISVEPDVKPIEITPPSVPEQPAEVPSVPETPSPEHPVPSEPVPDAPPVQPPIPDQPVPETPMPDTTPEIPSQTPPEKPTEA